MGASAFRLTNTMSTERNKRADSRNIAIIGGSRDRYCGDDIGPCIVFLSLNEELWEKLIKQMKIWRELDDANMCPHNLAVRPFIWGLKAITVEEAPQAGKDFYERYRGFNTFENVSFGEVISWDQWHAMGGGSNRCMDIDTKITATLGHDRIWFKGTVDHDRKYDKVIVETEKLLLSEVLKLFPEAFADQPPG